MKVQGTVLPLNPLSRTNSEPLRQPNSGYIPTVFVPGINSTSSELMTKEALREEIQLLTKEWVAKGNEIKTGETTIKWYISESEIARKYNAPKWWITKQIQRGKFPKAVNHRKQNLNGELLFDAKEVADCMKLIKFTVKSK